MFSTPGAIQTAFAVLLCSLLTLTASTFWLAARVRRLSQVALRATRSAKAPEKWESKLRELETELVSLSSAFEKVTAQLRRLNSRAGMRELRAERDEDAPPPPGASKAELRKYYGLTRDGPAFATRQLELVRSE